MKIQQSQPSFLTLLLMISFASVNAVLFTPALPSIAKYFWVSNDAAQQTLIWFLVGYAIGQLIYGPIANRFGRKAALFTGIGLQILSSLLCVLAGYIHVFDLLLVGRFFQALGSGVGLKMTFTLVNECYESKLASEKISYLMLAFAITPALGVAAGGLLTTHLGWTSCFYSCALYGVILFLLVTQLSETQSKKSLDALTFKNLYNSYRSQFKNLELTAGGLLMGLSTAFVYVFAAIAPFIAINLLGMSSMQYGLANIVPPIGLILGSLVSARLAKKNTLDTLIIYGIWISAGGILIMLVTSLAGLPAIYSIFLPMIMIYFGLCFVLANASTRAMSKVIDKAQGSAVMNFINMGLATLAVLSLSFFQVHLLLLPIMYFFMIIAMMMIYKYAP